MGKVMGRKPKGPRDQFIVRPTSAVGKRIREEAASTGRTYQDVCAEKLAAAYGLPAFNDIEPSGQEPLLMTG